jgi:hypothetical protein
MNEEQKKLDEISASIKRCYDSLTDEEVAEDRAWGEFALAQFAREDCSDEWQGKPTDLSEDSSEDGPLPIARRLPND